MGGEVVGQQVQGRVELAGGGQVVDRLGQRPAEQQGPDAVDRRAGEVRVPRVGDPGGELLAGLPDVRQQLGAETARRARPSTGSLVLRSSGRYSFSRVADAAEVGVDAAEEGGQAAEVGLLPGLERVVVALGAVEPHAQERPDTRAASRSGVGRSRSQAVECVDRPPLKLPDNARLVFWTIVNYEVWDIERPMARQVLPAPTGVPLLPDVPNWSWHEYGMRVGAWRFFELFERLGIRPTLATNARICEDYPRVAEQAKSDGWEFMGHAYDQMPIHKVEDQRGDDQPLDGHHRELHRQAAGRLARAGPDADARHARAARRGRRANTSATGSMTTSRP